MIPVTILALSVYSMHLSFLLFKKLEKLLLAGECPTLNM